MTSDERVDASRAAKEPTMADVADHLGVSRQLVSLVLRDQPGPSARTRERVRKAASDLGYRPNLGAQVLRQSKSTRIGVGFFPSNINEAEILDQMYISAEEAGYSLVLSAQTPQHGTASVLAELQGHRCAGIVLIGSTLDTQPLLSLVQQSLAPVALVSQGTVNADFDVIRSAGAEGIAECVDYLCGLGHRDVAYVDVPSISPAPNRLDGYLRACRTLDLDPQVASISVGRPEEEGAAAARALLAGERVPTGVVCANDQSALGAAMVFLESGLRIPQDLSITGFDDSRIASWSFMELTSARQDPAAMGEAAVDAILRRVEDPAALPKEFVIRPTLVVRGSTSAPAR